ncbi:MAG TPA: hypothetical protein VFB81_08935, partial [Myxococcales bacterium]|nr:hypothetical protein [Myxococcales bacterium]
ALSVHHGELPLELCVEVSGLDTEQRVFRAMDELVDKEVLAEAGGRVRFLHGGFREALSLALPEERRRLLHRRMGEALLAASGAGERDGEIGWHLLRGGDEARGAERLEYAGRRLYDAQSVPDCLAPLQAAVEVYARLGKPPKLLVELRYLLIVAGAIADPEAGLRQVEPLLSDCARWAGLTRVLEERRPLSGLGLAARLLGATVRWLLTPGERRGPSPLAALSMFLHASACAATTAALMHDLESLRGTIERVELLFPSPWKTFTFSRCLLSYLRSLWSFVTTNYGQVQRYTAEVLALVRCSPASWLSTRNHRMLEASMRLMAATVAVAHPDPTIHRAQLAAAEKIGLRIFEGHLALVRSQLHRVRGEEELALEHDGRAELSFLSTGVMRSAEVQRPITASMGYLVTRDVLGLRRCLEELDQVNARGGKYHGLYELLCGEYLRERGELDPALAALRRAQSLVHPEIRPVHQLILAGIAEVQIAQGLHAEARRTAEEACAVGRDFDQGFFLSWVKAERALALAEAMGGDPAAGAARLDRALQSLAEIDSPAVVGTLHEARALVALMQEDREAHGRHAAALEALYSRTHNPVLLARSQRILDAGRTPQRVPSMTQLASEVVTIAGAHEASDSPVASGDQA